MTAKKEQAGGLTYSRWWDVLAIVAFLGFSAFCFATDAVAPGVAALGVVVAFVVKELWRKLRGDAALPVAGVPVNRDEPEQ